MGPARGARRVAVRYVVGGSGVAPLRGGRRAQADVAGRGIADPAFLGGGEDPGHGAGRELLLRGRGWDGGSRGAGGGGRGGARRVGHLPRAGGGRDRAPVAAPGADGGRAGDYGGRAQGGRWPPGARRFGLMPWSLGWGILGRM